MSDYVDRGCCISELHVSTASMFASYCCHIGYSAPLRRRRWSFGQNRTTCRTAKSAVDRPRLQYYEMCEFSLTVTGLWSFAYLSPNRLQRSHPWPYQNRSLVILRCFSPHRLQMRAVATDVARSMLCLSVCPLVTTVSSAKRLSRSRNCSVSYIHAYKNLVFDFHHSLV